MTMIRLYAALALVAILMLTVASASAERSINAQDKCAFFDTWIGGERFDYQVNAFGNWNLPEDVEPLTTVTFPNSGLWTYYSPSQNAQYVIVFLSLEPSGTPLGQHNICVYKVKQ